LKPLFSNGFEVLPVSKLSLNYQDKERWAEKRSTKAVNHTHTVCRKL